MAKSTATATAESTETEPHQGDQLRLRVFAVLDGCKGRLPEKALFRELLKCALGGADTFTIGKRTVAASAVKGLAWAIYGRSDRSGVTRGFPLKVLADDAGLTDRSASPALAVLRRADVIRTTQDKRRKPADHAIVDWPAVLKRSARHDMSSGLTAPVDFRGDDMSCLRPDEMSPLKGYNVGLRDQERAGTTKISDTLPRVLDRARESAPAFEPGSAFMPDDDDEGGFVEDDGVPVGEDGEE